MSGGPGRAGSATAPGRVIDAVRSALEALQSQFEGGLCVGLSGGLDSSVLLHALVSAGVGTVRAVYVNHQLNPRAADWGRHCERLCATLGVPLLVRVVAVEAASGEGLEAAARRARYRALAGSLRPGELLLTAHHQGDQAETVLIHLLRGSGVAGLRGIPRVSVVEDCRVLRPLLGLSRAELLVYARAAGLEWIEDPANDDRRMDRNFLRHEILPLLAGRWPDAGATIARSARHCAEAAELTDALAVLDLGRVRRKGRLSVPGLKALGEARQRNAIRVLCRQATGSVPPEARLREGLAQLLNAASDRNPLLKWRGGELRRYRSALYLLPSGADASAPSQPLSLPVRPGATLDLSPGLGRLRLVRARGQGIAPARLGPALAVRFRAGGEQLRPDGSAHTRDLKKLLQERGVVPWMRERIPLLYADDTLVAVAGFWVAAGFAAAGTEAGLRVRWDGHPALD
jgi:tRNA(Ile)-lysidine synthase